MAGDFMYTKAMSKAIDFANDDLRVLLVMLNSTALTDEDAEFISDIGTLDEYDGAGYARVAMTGKTWTPDTVNDRGPFTSDPIIFPSLAVGTRQVLGYIIYKHVGADSANIPVFYKSPTGFPFNGNGEDVTINPHADGWAYTRNGAV